MATKQPSYTWENGFRQLATKPASLQCPKADSNEEDGGATDCAEHDPQAYVVPPAVELISSPVHNRLGINIIRHWPTIYDGSNSPHGSPSWWQPQQQVDVLICGAGPSGLAVASSLARQGVSFRIIDKAGGPLTGGRADGVQPRFLETVSQWGLSTEMHEEGPLIDRTAIYKDGKKLLFNRSHQSDSRYRGLHVITQGQIERIYIRDLARHKVIVERNCFLSDFRVNHTIDDELYPVHATVRNDRTGQETVVRSKFIVGSDGATSSVRKALKIPFDGVNTNIYWGIMDCIFESDYPHAWIFGSVISSKHGGCVIIPREDGYIRLYTQLDVSHTGPIAASRMAKDPTFTELGGSVDINSITPEEVLEQANRIFDPYTLKFMAPLSWFAIWRISERVARSYSSPDMRVHLVGDAAHVHSVMGAFGLNASILDAANIAWKLGMAAKGRARTETLLGTYGSERRQHAVRIIEVSGTYLRFVCGSVLALPSLRDVTALDDGNIRSVTDDTTANEAAELFENGSAQMDSVNGSSSMDGSQEEDLAFLQSFFKAHGQFLLGVDCPYGESVLSLADGRAPQQLRPIDVKNGVRAPNPRVCFSATKTGYLYDKFAGVPRFHIILFASSLGSREVSGRVGAFLASLQDPKGFYHRFGGQERFNFVLVLKMLPFEWESASVPQSVAVIKATLPRDAIVVYDDRAPDEDAHTIWGVNHFTGGVAVVRPDLWVSFTAFPDETERISQFFDEFML